MTHKEPTSDLQVFITHASDDAWVASQIEEKIAACGANTFLDCNDIKFGDEFEAKIREGAYESSEQLVLLTPWAIDRPYVWLEIGHFWCLKKRIVVILYGLSKEAFASDERIPLYLKSINVLHINEIDSYLDDLHIRVEKKHWAEISARETANEAFTSEFDL